MQSSRGILWRTEPHREVSIPAAVSQGAVTAGETVPRRLTALPALPMGISFGAAQAGEPLGGQVPKGERVKVSSVMPPNHLAQCRARTRGAPVSLYNVVVPAASRNPRGPTGWVPGADVTLGWQRGEGLGPAAQGGRCFAARSPPSCSSWFPRTVAGTYF